MTLLAAHEVTVRFGGHTALDSVSLSVPAGAIVGLIGPNGAGKTTLFNVFCGMEAADRGRVVLNGIDLVNSAPHDRAQRGLARTFQRIELFGSLTARENLLVAAEIRRRWGGSGASASQRVDDAVKLTGMSRFADRQADVLTTGQARLVELARAVVTQPRVLLLDEPASGLDAKETEHFADVLRTLAAQGIAILLVEHDIPLVMQLCERVTVLEYGRVIAEGTAAQVQADQAVVDAYLGAPAVGGAA
jgi:branched-chain amino acid transport system ATP-binding protein